MDSNSEACNPLSVLESPLKKPKVGHETVTPTNLGDGGGSNEDINVEGGHSGSKDSDLEEKIEGEEEDDGFDSGDCYSNEEERKNYHKYLRHLNKTEGFHVDPNLVPGHGCFGAIIPLDLNDPESSFARWAKKATMLAIDSYNANHEDHQKLIFKEFVKANASDCVYYVTIRANDIDGVTKTYQIMVFYRPYGKEELDYSFRLHFLRPEQEISDDESEDD